MKKFLVLLLVSSSVIADGHHHHHGHHNAWIAPVIGATIGGAIVYNYTRPQYQPMPQPYPYGGYSNLYHYETIFDSSCYCYKQILVLN
jgi:hypothetical protein